MARSDLLINLVRAGWKGDRNVFKTVAEAIIAEERAKQHHSVADNLVSIFQQHNCTLKSPTVMDERIQNLIFEETPRKSLADLILTDDVLSVCNELIEEHSKAELLRSHGLEPRNRVLLQGAPGNGKTSLANAIAASLAVPLFTVRYDGIIDSYLGETAIRLKKLFEYVRTRRCVLFFDEFDTIGKERGDVHETGEIKRVVSSLLLQIDSLPSHVVVVVATNHPELLDRAVWRRFQIRLNLPSPSQKDILQWLRREQVEVHFAPAIGYSSEDTARQLQGASFAELEEFCLMAKRRNILLPTDADRSSILNDCLNEWKCRKTQTGGFGWRNNF